MNFKFFNDSLNNILGNGIPFGSFIEICGEKCSGKTTLSYYIIKNAQKQKLNCCYFDIENNFDKEYSKNCGINNKEILIFLENELEYINKYLLKLINNSINIIIFDSWAGIKFNNENLDKLINDWRNLVKDKQIIFIFINQNRNRIQTFREVSFNKRIMEKQINIRIKTKKLNVIEFNHKYIGQKIELMTIKNIFNKPFEKIELDIYNDEGISDNIYLINKMINNNQIQKINHFYYYKDKLIAKGLEDFRQKVKNKNLILC